MNPMLKAQMLAPALDVYFSNPGLGGNKINAPAPIGGLAIDLTNVCGSGGGAPTTASTPPVPSAAPPNSRLPRC
jgi:hypothetical protein